MLYFIMVSLYSNRAVTKIHMTQLYDLFAYVKELDLYGTDTVYSAMLIIAPFIIARG